MASIRVRPETKKLYFDFHWRGIRCREYTSLPDIPANRKKMQAVLKKIEADIALNQFDYARYFPGSAMGKRFAGTNGPVDGRMTSSPKPAASDTPVFSDFVEIWWRDREVEWRHSYRTAVDSILKTHLLPAFGEIPIGSIDRAMLMAFRARLASRRIGEKRGSPRQTLDPSTVNRIMGILRQILEEGAARYGFTNPALTIKRLKVKRIDIEPFTMEEVRQILEMVRKDYQPYLTVRFFTGMRSGEVHGLKWKHIDFGRREILVRETYAKGRTEYTKTDGSQREIRMSQPVFEALQKMRPEQVHAEGYVFRTRNGLPIDNKNFNDRVWNPLLRHLDLKRRRPYQMRHTCATLWLAAGENPEWIARQLGHTTTEMLFRVYSRYVPNLTRHDGTAFDRLVSAAVHGGVRSTDVTEKKEVGHG